MQARRDLPLLMALTVVLAGCRIDEFVSLGNAHAYEKEFHQYYPLKSGARLSLENFNGSVQIRGWDQEKVEIDGVQYGATPRLRDAIQTDVVANGDSLRIRTVRPIGFRGSMGVQYIIKAPRRVNLDRVITTNGSLRLEDLEGALIVRTSNGTVRALNLRGELDIQTTNGSVEVSGLEGPATIRTTNGTIRANEIRGSLEASTSNGGIDALLRRPEPRRPVRLTTKNGRIQLTMDSLDNNDVRASTTNGGIILKLPSQVGARVHAQTSHNSIHSDFDVTGNADNDKNRLDGSIGGGGPTLDLTTTNGAIRLLKF